MVTIRVPGKDNRIEQAGKVDAGDFSAHWPACIDCSFSNVCDATIAAWNGRSSFPVKCVSDASPEDKTAFTRLVRYLHDRLKVLILPAGGTTYYCFPSPDWQYNPMLIAKRPDAPPPPPPSLPSTTPTVPSFAAPPPMLPSYVPPFLHAHPQPPPPPSLFPPTASQPALIISSHHHRGPPPPPPGPHPTTPTKSVTFAQSSAKPPQLHHQPSPPKAPSFSHISGLKSTQNGGSQPLPVKPPPNFSMSKQPAGAPSPSKTGTIKPKLPMISALTPPSAPTPDSQFCKTLSMHPSTLSSNSQIHEWILGAAAELFDNSKDARATKMWVDTIQHPQPGHPPILTFTDNGCGMDPSAISQMMDMGHEEIRVGAGLSRYGVGFKTGSMKMGTDALVLSVTPTSKSLAFLSQTLNHGRKNIRIPILHFDKLFKVVGVLGTGFDVTLAGVWGEITRACGLRQTQILEHFKQIPENHGTKILIFNPGFGLEASGKPDTSQPSQFDFDSDPLDVRVRCLPTGQLYTQSRANVLASDIPLDYSLRAFAARLFLDSQMSIIVKGAPVPRVDPAAGLTDRETYKFELKGNQHELVIGHDAAEKERNLVGFHIYHKKRLVQTYYAPQAFSSMGKCRGLIGVVDLPDVRPKNNKQGFDSNDSREVFAKLNNFAQLYIEAHIDHVVVEPEAPVDKDTSKEWIRCDLCQKWRVARNGTQIPPEGVDWFCWQNLDTNFNKCEIPQEPDEEDEVTFQLGSAVRQIAPTTATQSGDNQLVGKRRSRAALLETEKEGERPTKQPKAEKSATAPKQTVIQSTKQEPALQQPPLALLPKRESNDKAVEPVVSPASTSDGSLEISVDLDLNEEVTDWGTSDNPISIDDD